MRCTCAWPGITSDQYDAVMARLGLDANPPAGGVLHMATDVTDEGVEVCDIWQTEQAFNGFLEQRLLPVVSELGLAGEARGCGSRSTPQLLRRRPRHDQSDRRRLPSGCGRELVRAESTVRRRDRWSRLRTAHRRAKGEACAGGRKVPVRVSPLA